MYSGQNIRSLKFKLFSLDSTFLLANKFEEEYALLKNDHVFEMLAKETNNGSKIV